MTDRRENISPTRQIPFARVCCDGQELNLIQEVLQSGWLTTADKTRMFEERFAAAVNAEFACAVNSCTAALHLALEAVGIGPGDKVFVPTMTFTSTAEVVRYLGADPVFLDVDYGTCLVTPDLLEEAIARCPEARALMVVHYGGQAAPMLGNGNAEGILSACRKHGLRVIEDAAHAFPSRCQGQMVGSIGDVTCFSFYANKPITTGEGGMITTNDEGIAKRVRVMRLHGINRDIWNRFSSVEASWEYDVIAPGFKYNMPDVNAAIGLAQMDRAFAFRAERERCARFYMKELGELEWIDLPRLEIPFADHAWHLYPIVLGTNSPVGRSRFIDLMAERGIGTSVHYKPLHRMTYYRQYYKLDPGGFPNAEKFWAGCVSLPIYPSLSDVDLAYVCSVIKDIGTVEARGPL